MTWRILQGDALEVLRTLPEASAQTCVTSPPYFGLRDYGTATWSGGDPACSHRGRPKPRQDTSGSGPDKGRFAATRGTQPAKAAFAIPVRGTCSCGAVRLDKQLGIEPTVDEYVDRLLEVMGEVRRVLKEDGTLWLNLGDCYASDAFGGSIARAGIEGGNKGQVASRAARVAARRPYGLAPKQLIGVPWRVALALQADGWWLRSDIVWHKPNPMPESVRDRPTRAHEYIFLLAKSERYFYDAKAIEEPAVFTGPNGAGTNSGPYAQGFARRTREEELARQAGKRRKTDAHPSPRVPGFNERWEVAAAAGELGLTRNKRSVWTVATQPFNEAHFATFPPALIRPCILAGSRPGDLVIDPFCGAATVGLEAQRLGRDFIGSDLSADYVAMGSRRIVADAPLWNTPATEALS